jgi:magnesium-transporting ATPase (P-type)
MLTGDKLETAENIARSCKLIAPDMQVFYVRDDNAEDLSNTFSAMRTKWHQTPKKSVIVEGNSLRII